MHRVPLIALLALSISTGCDKKPVIELTSDETAIDLLDSTKIRFATYSKKVGANLSIWFEPGPGPVLGCCEWDFEVSPIRTTTYSARVSDSSPFPFPPLNAEKTLEIVVNRDIPISRISFPDPALEACVAASGATMTSELTSIACPALGIEDLSGLEYLTYLTSADFSGNAVTSLDPQRLAMSLDGGLDLDLTGSTGMRCLERALLGDLFGDAVLPASCTGPEPTPVSDLTFESFYFQACWTGASGAVRDRAIAGLPPYLYADEVETLNCYGGNLDFTAHMPELLAFRNVESLELESMRTEGTIPADPFALLASLPLTHLTIDVSAWPGQPLLLPSLPDLRSLGLELPGLPDLGFLAQTPGLTRLSIDRGPSITDYSALASLANLTDLELQNAIDDSTVLPTLGGLERLSLEGSQLTDAGTLAGFTSLEYLSLRHTEVIDYGPLTALPVLEELVLDHAGGSRARPTYRPWRVSRRSEPSPPGSCSSTRFPRSSPCSTSTSCAS